MIDTVVLYPKVLEFIDIMYLTAYYHSEKCRICFKESKNERS